MRRGGRQGGTLCAIWPGVQALLAWEGQRELTPAHPLGRVPEGHPLLSFSEAPLTPPAREATGRVSTWVR